MAFGAAVMVILALVVNAAQPPAAATVYVTVYIPTVDVARVTAPVLALITSPAVDVYVPPVVHLQYHYYYKMVKCHNLLWRLVQL
jgi:hypothetical protein